MEIEENDINKMNKTVLRQTVFIGWIGGIIFGILIFILFYFKLIDPNISSMIIGKIKLFNHWYGKLVLLIFLSILSMIVTLFYYMIAKKMSQWYIGMFFGIFIWFIVCTLYYIYFNQNLIFNQKTIHESINLLCLFILYGLFVGYSTSFAYELQLTQLQTEHNHYKSSTDYDKI